MNKDNKLMPPQWIKYPELSEFTMGWRMGYGEEYRYHFWDWYDTLTSKQQQEYQKLFPYPVFWHHNNWKMINNDGKLSQDLLIMKRIITLEVFPFGYLRECVNIPKKLLSIHLKSSSFSSFGNLMPMP